MTGPDLEQLLATIAAQEPGRTLDTIAWAEQLAGVTLDQAQAALGWYRRRTDAPVTASALAVRVRATAGTAGDPETAKSGAAACREALRRTETAGAETPGRSS